MFQVAGVGHFGIVRKSIFTKARLLDAEIPTIPTESRPWRVRAAVAVSGSFWQVRHGSELVVDAHHRLQVAALAPVAVDHLRLGLLRFGW